MIRLLSLLTLLTLSSALAPAQNRSGNYHSPNRGRSHRPASSYRHQSRSSSRVDQFGRALRTIDNVASIATTAAIIAQFDSYTSVRIGYNAASLRPGGALDDYAEADGILSGFNAGIFWGFRLGRSSFFLEPGLMYSGKGGRLQGRDLATYDSQGQLVYDYHYHTRAYFHTFEIPLVLKYDLPLTSVGPSLQPFVGGFFSVGSGGETRLNGDGWSSDYDTFSDAGFRSVDAGLRFGCGLQIDALYLDLAYDLGLVDLPRRGFTEYNYDRSTDHLRSSCLTLSVGVVF